MVAAILGSAITLGSMKVLDLQVNEGQTLKIEHVDGTPVVQTGYSGDAAAINFDFSAAAEKTMPAVVHIRSTITSSVQTQGNQQIPEQFRDFFGPFFRQGPSDQQPAMGSGSGVIINPKGYIVTNNHVVKDASDIDVTLSDNRSYKAKVIGTDPTTDVALIKIDETDLPSVSLFNSDDVKVGEWVLAVGNPFNLESTVTAGIVSAKGRSINILNTAGPNDSTNAAIESFIQTDAAVNPGNSGGALVNLNGDLVGINTAIASPTGSYSGYAFAVPANIVSRVVEDLMAYGTVQRGMLGVQINNINSAFARDKGLNVNAGAYVAAVQDGTAAKTAGIHNGDVITAVDDHQVSNTAELIGYIGSKRPGDKVAVKVNRGGETKEFEVVLKNKNGTTDIIKEEKPEIMTTLGADLSTVDSPTLKKMGLRAGVQVKALHAGKLRSETDIQEGFVITKIDGKSVSSVDDVTRKLENRSGGVLIEGMYPNSPKVYYYGLGLD